jgi:hypothetical protein
MQYLLEQVCAGLLTRTMPGEHADPPLAYEVGKQHADNTDRQRRRGCYIRYRNLPPAQPQNPALLGAQHTGVAARRITGGSDHDGDQVQSLAAGRLRPAAG